MSAANFFTQCFKTSGLSISAFTGHGCDHSTTEQRIQAVERSIIDIMTLVETEECIAVNDQAPFSSPPAPPLINFISPRDPPLSPLPPST
mmetsp:Transcript_5876/g.14325  ORF Transcript_5876/g.14325 Transcript_5876/m.14325 type:complete len:90 (-) Transcript_5876:40-309(-)